MVGKGGWESKGLLVVGLVVCVVGWLVSNVSVVVCCVGVVSVGVIVVEVVC